MKTTITLLAIFTIIMNVSYGTVRTVSNIGGAQYNSFLNAYNASSDNDTLIIEGTNIEYIWNTGQQWSKSLVVIGSGFNTQKMNYRRTKLATMGVCCDPQGFIFSSGSSGSKFYGIEFSRFVSIVNSSLSNLIFEDCNFAFGFNFGSQPSSNIVFKNCIFDGDNERNIFFPGNGACNNILVTNCIFDGYIDGSMNSVSSLTIDHCVFLFAGANQNLFNSLVNALVKNSVIMNITSLESGGSSGITYENNISYLSGFPSGSGNKSITNPNFVNYSLMTYYNTAYNFNLALGSPAIGAGSDGTDIGVHGGNSNFSETGEVLINPIMRTLIINNSTTVPNGIINVHINATKPNDN